MGLRGAGAYKHEKRFAVAAHRLLDPAFYIGVAFAYLFVFPVMFEFFVNTTPEGVKSMPDISNYLDFVLMMSLAFGVAFEVPIGGRAHGAHGHRERGQAQEVARLRPHRGVRHRRVLDSAGRRLPSIMAVPMYLLYEGGMLMAGVRVEDAADRQDREGAARPDTNISRPRDFTRLA